MAAWRCIPRVTGSMAAVWWSPVKASTISGAPATQTTVATARPTIDTVRTAEMDFHASLARWCSSSAMKTGTKVAETTPPSTRSKIMLGIWLARLKASAIGVRPSAQARTSTRSSPLPLDTMVPSAIEETALLSPADCVLDGGVEAAPGDGSGVSTSHSTTPVGSTRKSAGSLPLRWSWSSGSSSSATVSLVLRSATPGREPPPREHRSGQSSQDDADEGEGRDLRGDEVVPELQATIGARQGDGDG